MPSLGDLLGLNGAKKIKQASADAVNMLNTGNDSALALLGKNNAAINQGYDSALSYLTGSTDRARGELNQGYGAATDYLNTGYGGAISAAEAGRDSANARLDPFVQSGLGAQGLYDNALGVNGTGAASDFYSNYASNDPFRAYRDELAQREIERRYNATGGYQGGANGGGSGAFATATARASLERGTQDLQTYLDRLERAGARGAQYAGQQGTNDMTAAGQIGNYNVNRGTALATNATNQGSALAGLTSNLGAQQANLATGRAAALGSNNVAMANQTYGNAQQLASNRINTANGVNAANAVPLQNAINIAGTAISAFKPSPLSSLKLA